MQLLFSLKGRPVMDEFIAELHRNIDYWLRQYDLCDKEKLEGCTFSILCMLDGVSGSWYGDIYSLLNDSTMLHDNFYKERGE